MSERSADETLDQSVAPSAERLSRDLAAWSFWAGSLLFAAMAVPFWAGRLYVADDLGAFHLPIRAHYAQQLARGQPFDWMPQLFCGFYLSGEGQLGGYHPLHWLLYRLLPLPTAFAWELLLSYPLMMVGMWLFLRRLLNHSPAAAAGSLWFTFCSFNLAHFVHPNAVAIIAHIPWLLWSIDIVLVDARRRRVTAATAVMALLTGSQLALGYPQYVWFSWLIEAGYAGFVWYTHRFASRRECDQCLTCADCVGCHTATWPRLLLAQVAGVMLGGVQLLPTLDAWLHSPRRTADADFAAWGSLHPLNLVQLVAPYLFTGRVAGDSTHEFSLYLGVVPLTLIVWLLARRGQWRRFKPLVRAAGGLALLALLMAMGQYTPLYRCVARLPLAQTFRCPCRYVVLVQFAASVLAAIGFVLLLREHVRPAEVRARGGRVLSLLMQCGLLWRDFLPVWALLAVAGITAVAGLTWRHEPHIASVPLILTGPALFFAAAVLVVLAARGSRAALIGLILLAAGDQGCYGLSYAAFRRTATFDQWRASAQTPPGRNRGRVLATLLAWNQPGLRTGNQMTLAGWSRADGYAGLEPSRRLDYHDLPALRVAGVRWVQRGPTTADILGLKPYDQRWLQVPHPLPRVRLVSFAAASSSPSRDLRHVNPSRVALTDVPLTLTRSTPGKVTLVAERPGRLEIEVACPERQLLVVNESFHDGWRVAVNGQPRRVYRVDGDFMGCLAGPGKERLVWTFQPDSLAYGWLATYLGLALVPLCFWGYPFPRRAGS